VNVDIVVVNWNSGKQLEDCIASIRHYHGGLVGRCIVVDNGSTDNSAEFLAEAADVELILKGKNLGFGRASNLGVARGRSPFILLLNPDARLMEGSLSAPASFLQQPGNATVGIVGVQLVSEKGDVQRTCARAPSEWTLIAKTFGLASVFKCADFQMKFWDHLDTRNVDQVMGAFFLVRRDLFEKLGGFDERFFVYFEEVDFSRRAAAAGFKTVYLSEAQAFHRGGGVSEQVKARRLFYSLRSRIQYAFKHFSLFGAMMVTGTSLLVEPISRLLLLVFRRRWNEIGDLGLAYYLLWGWVLGRLRVGQN
jgi:GT2 family glycosyltransferase